VIRDSAVNLYGTTDRGGAYWYHPHVHGLTESAVQGGASGAIVVEGIQSLQPGLVGLPERVLVIRDQVLPSGSSATAAGEPPAWEVSIKYVPIPYPSYPPAVLEMKPEQKQFWRVLNASADTIIDLQLQYDHVPQILQLAALDGVPVDSQDGTAQGKLIPKTDILLPPAGRAEFIVTGPSATVQQAILETSQGRSGASRPPSVVATARVRMGMRAAEGAR